MHAVTKPCPYSQPWMLSAQTKSDGRESVDDRVNKIAQGFIQNLSEQPRMPEESLVKRTEFGVYT